LAVLCDAYHEEEVDGDKRIVMKFDPKMAPIKAAVLPLVKKDGIAEMAQDFEKTLRKKFNTFYDQAGAIGRRYRRMDEVGTPFCICVDYDSKEDNTVTVRDRDSMEQARMPMVEVAAYIQTRCSNERD
jgi:glycyl-tRNA synthetase